MRACDFLIQNLFIQNFKEGALNPSIRPTLNNLCSALHKYEYCLKKGTHDNNVRPTEEKDWQRLSACMQAKKKTTKEKVKNV